MHRNIRFVTIISLSHLTVWSRIYGVSKFEIGYSLGQNQCQNSFLHGFSWSFLFFARSFFTVFSLCKVFSLIVFLVFSWSLYDMVFINFAKVGPLYCRIRKTTGRAPAFCDWGGKNCMDMDTCSMHVHPTCRQKKMNQSSAKL